jgi:hypothetical protein
MPPCHVIRAAFLLASGISIGGFWIPSQIAAAEPAKTRTVQAGELKLKVPATWQEGAVPAGGFRLAQFMVPKGEGDSDNGEFVVFFFQGAGGTGGGVDANVARWVNQFEPQGRKVKLTSGKCPQGDYVVVDLQGTWNKPIGPPILQKTAPTPESRVVSVILTVKDQGNYFLRLTGPKKTIAANVAALRAAFGAEDEKSEKTYKPATE